MTCSQSRSFLHYNYLLRRANDTLLQIPSLRPLPSQPSNLKDWHPPSTHYPPNNNSAPTIQHNSRGRRIRIPQEARSENSRISPESLCLLQEAAATPPTSGLPLSSAVPGPVNPKIPQPRKPHPKKSDILNIQSHSKSRYIKSWRVEIGWDRIVATNPSLPGQLGKSRTALWHFPLHMLPSPLAARNASICLSFAWCDHIQIISAISRLLHANETWLEEKKPRAWLFTARTLFSLVCLLSVCTTEKERLFRLQTPLSATAITTVCTPHPFPLFIPIPCILVHKVICAQHIVPTPGKASPPQQGKSTPRPYSTLFAIHPSSWV